MQKNWLLRTNPSSCIRTLRIIVLNLCCYRFQLFQLFILWTMVLKIPWFLRNYQRRLQPSVPQSKRVTILGAHRLFFFKQSRKQNFCSSWVTELHHRYSAGHGCLIWVLNAYMMVTFTASQTFLRVKSYVQFHFPSKMWCRPSQMYEVSNDGTSLAVKISPLQVKW
jgi:hypothetical protein